MLKNVPLILEKYQFKKKAAAFFLAYIIGCLFVCVFLTGLFGVMAAVFSFVAGVIGLPFAVVGFLFYFFQEDYSIKRKLLNLLIPVAIADAITIYGHFYIDGYQDNIYFLCPVFVFAVSAFVWYFHSLIVED
jgi:hypothetical protein